VRRPGALLAAVALAGALAGCGKDVTSEEQRAMDRALLVGPSPIALAAGEGGVFVIDDEERSLRRFDASPLHRKGGPIRLPGHWSPGSPPRML